MPGDVGRKEIEPQEEEEEDDEDAAARRRARIRERILALKGTAGRSLCREVPRPLTLEDLMKLYLNWSQMKVHGSGSDVYLPFHMLWNAVCPSEESAQDKGNKEEHEFAEEEEESEYETDTDDEDEEGPTALFKPIFIPKVRRHMGVSVCSGGRA